MLIFVIIFFLTKFEKIYLLNANSISTKTIFDDLWKFTDIFFLIEHILIMSFTCRDYRLNFTDPSCTFFIQDLYYYSGSGIFMSTEKVDNHVCRRCNHPGKSHMNNNREKIFHQKKLIRLLMFRDAEVVFDSLFCWKYFFWYCSTGDNLSHLP